MIIMEPTKSGKLGAIKSDHHYQFVYNIVIHSLIALTCTFLCSYNLWFNSFNYFLFISLPKFWSSFLSPKCLFIVVNVIVFFLVGESKLLNSNSSSSSSSPLGTSTDVIYSEYVERSRSLRRSSVVDQEKKEETTSYKMDQIKLNDEIGINNRVMIEMKKQVISVEPPKDEENNEGNEEQERDRDDDDDDDQEECGLPAEELNKRAEEFIAKINKQRWLEARAS